MMVAQFVSRSPSTEMAVENCKCDCNKQTNEPIDNISPWSILLTTIEMTSKCSKRCSDTTRLHATFVTRMRNTNLEIRVADSFGHP